MDSTNSYNACKSKFATGLKINVSITKHDKEMNIILMVWVYQERDGSYSQKANITGISDGGRNYSVGDKLGT